MIIGENKKNISRYSDARQLKQLFKKVRNLCLVIHPNPDGDAMGSSLGLYNALRENKYKVSVVSPNGYPSFLSFLPGSDKVIQANKDLAKARKAMNSVDLIVVMDFNSLPRAENLKEVMAESAKPILLIDHHTQPDIQATYWFWDIRATSTCELVYHLIKIIFPSYRFSKKTSQCLYTGTMTDTGSFRFPRVGPGTHGMIKELLESGIKHHEIHEAVYDDYTYNRFQLMALALQKLTLCHNNKAAYIFLTSEELNKFNYKKGDTEGFVNLPLSIKGVVLSGFFMEQQGYIKISLRSKGNVDVNLLARKYMNGGGHINAAGGKWYGTAEELIKLFTNTISF